MFRKTINTFFEIEGRSTIRTEVLAGICTFLTMSYIAVVNPAILANAGMPQESVFVATCLTAAFGCLIMGLYANYPIAIAPGMGINAYFAIAIVAGMGLPWQEALGAVFCSGVLFLILSVLPVREWIVNSLPQSQKLAIGAGIGLFLTMIALRSMNIVVDDPATLVGVGDLASIPVLIAALGFVAIVALDHRQVYGAIAIGIVLVSIIMWIVDPSTAPDLSEAMKLPDVSGTFLQLKFPLSIDLAIVTVVLTLLLYDMFDTSGTLVAVLHQAKLLDDSGNATRLRPALVADSSSTIVGALFGTSTATAYIESGAGVRAGGRTGLVAAVTGLMFLLVLGFAPLALAVPATATAPAILFVGCVMTSSLRDLDWSDVVESVPAIVTAIAIPFSSSVATGIGMGFISYVAINVLCGRFRSVHPAMALIAACFTAKFIFVD